MTQGAINRSKLLKEAEVREHGKRLGETGGRIVVETFACLAMDDKESFLHVPGGFSPSLPSKKAGHFVMPDMLRFAGVL